MYERQLCRFMVWLYVHWEIQQGLSICFHVDELKLQGLGLAPPLRAE
jgi:hypothetical protein